MTLHVFIESVCSRCGKINEYEIKLAHSEDYLLYKCELCNFITTTSRSENDENED